MKTHKKVLVDGRNVWVPLDSLEVTQDTTIVPSPETAIEDSIAKLPGDLWQENLDYEHGTGHGVGSFLSVHEGPQAITKINNVHVNMDLLDELTRLKLGYSSNDEIVISLE